MADFLERLGKNNSLNRTHATALTTAALRVGRWATWFTAI